MSCAMKGDAFSKGHSQIEARDCLEIAFFASCSSASSDSVSKVSIEHEKVGSNVARTSN